jgi:hypothetical protein
VRRLGRVVLGGIAALVVLLVVATAWTARPGDPALYPTSEPDAETVLLVSHGWHSGIVLRRETVTGEGAGAALRNVATRFRDFSALEFGWGEARFYRATPTLAAFDWRLARGELSPDRQAADRSRSRPLRAEPVLRGERPLFVPQRLQPLGCEPARCGGRADDAGARHASARAAGGPEMAGRCRAAGPSSGLIRHLSKP